MLDNMKAKISINKYWEENISLLIIAFGFIELQSEAIHDILKWPMIGLGVVLLIGSYLRHRINKRISTIIILMIVLTIIEICFTDGILPTQYIWDFGICMPIALAMLYAQHTTPKKWLSLYAIVTIYLLVSLFTSPDFYTVFYNHSRNYISVFEIFLVFMAAVVAYKNNIELPGWIYYSTVIVCVVAVGRGGILAAFVLLGFHIIQNIQKEKQRGNKTAKLVMLLVAIVVGLFVFIAFQDVIIQKFFPRFARFGAAGESADGAVSKRLAMWIGYIDICTKSLKEFLLSSDPFPISIRFNYRNDFNLHNSYIMTHVFYGLIGLVGVIVYSVKFRLSKF